MTENGITRAPLVNCPCVARVNGVWYAPGMTRAAVFGAIVCIMHAVACGGATSDAAGASAGSGNAGSTAANGGGEAFGTSRLTSGVAPREYASEVHEGDAVVGTGHGKTFALTWSSPADVELGYRTGASDAVGSATGAFPALLRVESAEGDVHEHTLPAAHGRMYFKARAGVRYDVTLAGYDAHDQGAFLLAVSPPPAQEALPAAGPKPESKAPEAQVSDDEALAEAKRMREGYTLLGKTIVGTLSRPGKHTFAAKRGQCYRAVVTLGPGARLPYGAKGAIMPALALKTLAETRAGSFSASRYAGGGNARVLVSTDVCPSGAGTGTVSWADSAGTGAFALDIVARPIAENAVIARDVADESSYCAKCSRERLACAAKGTTAAANAACASGYERCLGRGAMTRAQCGAN